LELPSLQLSRIGVDADDAVDPPFGVAADDLPECPNPSPGAGLLSEPEVEADRDVLGSQRHPAQCLKCHGGVVGVDEPENGVRRGLELVRLVAQHGVGGGVEEEFPADGIPLPETGARYSERDLEHVRQHSIVWSMRQLHEAQTPVQRVGKRAGKREHDPERTFEAPPGSSSWSTGCATSYTPPSAESHLHRPCRVFQDMAHDRSS